MQPILTRDHALFLDLDGTLLEFAPTAEEVAVPEGLASMLRGLAAQRDGALAILSGRSLAQIDAVTGAPFPAGAEHGFVLRDAAGVIHHPLHETANRAAWRAALEAAAAAHPGVRIEAKSASLVAHFRAAPAAGTALREMIGAMIAASPEVELLAANMAWEIRPRGAGKGRALEWFMARPPFAGRVPVFVGDDVTDEEAIAAAAAQGGHGLHVHRDFGGRPGAVLAWLGSALVPGGV
ncbi:MAG TPA: trehalose-phosphatase [Acidiphilium sp.]|uniref:trehalose-phosphatase n=1 Tax=unclassified Acidiphilium TaxID=2617493 RepID=UPI000BC3678B|nr:MULTISPECIES: trehalose-phosphatase [unclassified Acidiphilium]OYV57340.1 MAG: trehalose-phosphatase [Acidiphilium sp. 20-67-58]HQT60476.1 trehalose-phosphatase [Acidiphilium sp.]HQU10446.1 trehalose-phosphatase [Acidiphilium sp.]